MPIELTDEDRAAIEDAAVAGVAAQEANPINCGGPESVSEEYNEAIYRAGIAAGLERAAKLIDDIADDANDWRNRQIVYACATGIRALSAPAASAAEP